MSTQGINVSEESGSGSKKLNKDIFSDPALKGGASDDPVYGFLSQWWRHILLAIGAVMVVIYFAGAFKENHRASMESSSDLLAKVQSEYQLFSAAHAEFEKASAGPAEKDEKPEERQQKIDEQKKQLDEQKAGLMQLINATSFAKEPYNQLGRLYAALVARTDGDTEALRKEAEVFSDWQSAKSGSQERFYKELGVLVVARAWLDDDSALADGRKMLVELADKGEYSAVSAALSLAAIAVTPEESREALTVLQGLNSRAPEQADLLRDEIKRLEAAAAK